MIFDSLLNNEGGSLILTKTVRELLFDGYKDPLLDFVKNFPGIESFYIPFEKFGWFVERNESSEYDGRFNMYTGSDNSSKMGILHSWNYENETKYYRDECSYVNGTTGELFPSPLSIEDDISVYATDVCRIITIAPDQSFSHLDINGFKWVADYRVFDNGIIYEPAECYCTSELSQCPDMPYGVLNVTDCKYGAPAFVSFPHFYLADPVFLEMVDGLESSKEDHEFYVALEPTTGLPLEVKAQLQINMLLQEDEYLT